MIVFWMVLLLCGSAYGADTFTTSLLNTNSGVTNARSGVSLVGVVDLERTKSNGVLYLTSGPVSFAAGQKRGGGAAGTGSSSDTGVTYEFRWAPANKHMSTSQWEAEVAKTGATRSTVPICRLTTNSATSPYAVAFEPLGGAEVAIFFYTSGISQFLVPTATVATGGSGAKPQPMTLWEFDLTMTGGQSGVSVFTSSSMGDLPRGSRYGEIKSVSGSSGYFTTDGITTPVSTSGVGNVILLNDTVCLTENELQNLKLDVGATTTTFHFKILSRDPLE
jgi:hypothetical protein